MRAPTRSGPATRRCLRRPRRRAPRLVRIGPCSAPRSAPSSCLCACAAPPWTDKQRVSRESRPGSRLSAYGPRETQPLRRIVSRGGRSAYLCATGPGDSVSRAALLALRRVYAEHAHCSLGVVVQDDQRVAVHDARRAGEGAVASNSGRGQEEKGQGAGNWRAGGTRRGWIRNARRGEMRKHKHDRGALSAAQRVRVEHVPQTRKRTRASAVESLEREQHVLAFQLTAAPHPGWPPCGCAPRSAAR